MCTQADASHLSGSPEDCPGPRVGHEVRSVDYTLAYDINFLKQNVDCRRWRLLEGFHCRLSNMLNANFNWELLSRSNDAGLDEGDQQSDKFRMYSFKV